MQSTKANQWRRVAVLVVAAVLCWAINGFGQEELPLRVVSAEAPLYPLMAQAMGIQGVVLLDVLIKKHEVVSAKALSGPPLLQRAATENVRSWKFYGARPAKLRVRFTYKLVGSTCGIHGETVVFRPPLDVELSAPGFVTCDPIRTVTTVHKARATSSARRVTGPGSHPQQAPDSGKWSLQEGHIAPSCGQSSQQLGRVNTTSVCEIVAAPSRFDGKLLCFPAEVRSDGLEFTMLFDHRCPAVGIVPLFRDTAASAEIDRAIYSTRPPGRKRIGAVFTGIVHWRRHHRRRFTLDVQEVCDIRVGRTKSGASPGSD